MLLKNPAKYFFITFLSFYATFSFSQRTLVTGKVTDKTTGQPIPFANVFFVNSKIATMTDSNGVYRIDTYYPTDSLAAFFIGYKKSTRRIEKDRKQIVDFQLSPSALSLKSVVIKYTGNPALKILKRVINNKKANNREKYADYDYNVYNKVEFDLNNFKEKFEHRKIFKPINFIFDYVDTMDGKRFLPIFISESFSKYYYRQNPKNEKEYIEGTKVSGVKNKSVTKFLGDMYSNVNIYDNYVGVFGKQFVSPIANFGKGFYHYYLTDSAFIDGSWCYRIDFKPKHKQTPVFQGTMWISDTTYAVKEITAQIANHANINFINSFHVHQVYKKVDGQYWMLKKDQILVDFALAKKTMGLYGRKTTIYDSIKVNHPQPNGVYAPDENVILAKNADKRDTTFWNKARLDTLSQREKQIYHMVDTLRTVPFVKGTIDFVAMVLSGYLNWGNFQVGPYFTFYSYNPIEGNRFRFGGRTSSKFSRKLELGGYLAYGLRDNAFKYGGSYRELLQKKNHQMIALNYSHDVAQLGQSDNAFQESNVLNSILRRGPNNKLTMIDNYKASFGRDLFSDFSTKLIFQHRLMIPLGSLSYKEKVGDVIINKPNIITTDVSVYLRFAYKEKFISGDLDRISLGTKYPIFEAQYTRGLKGVWNSQYVYDKLELGLSGYAELGIFGYTDFKIRAGKLWGTVPYPLLELPSGNETYFYDDEAFNLMNYFEFVGNEYLSVFVTHHFNGFILNRIPLMRKLKWRAVVGARGVIGSLDSTHLSNVELLPNMYPLSLTNPYVEASVGIENIFKIFRVDALWRLTYLNHPNISNFGIRATFNITF